MTPDEQQQQSNRLHAFAADLRGQFLGATTWIEPLLADIIAGFFCGNTPRQSFFFSEIAQPMPLNRKTRLLCRILKHEFPALHKSHSDIGNRIDKLREFRNILAHAHIDTSQLGLSNNKLDSITFITYEAAKLKRLQISYDDATRRADEANQLRDELIAIQQTITPKA